MSNLGTRSRGRPRTASWPKGQDVATAKMTDARVLRERAGAALVIRRNKGLPPGWTARRADWLAISRSAFEALLFGDSYRHLAGAVSRARARGRR